MPPSPRVMSTFFCRTVMASPSVKTMGGNQRFALRLDVSEIDFGQHIAQAHAVALFDAGGEGKAQGEEQRFADSIDGFGCHVTSLNVGFPRKQRVVVWDFCCFPRNCTLLLRPCKVFTVFFRRICVMAGGGVFGV